MEERRNKSLDKAREAGRGWFHFHGYQGWTHEDFSVFVAGYMIGVTPYSPPNDVKGPEHALMFAYGFHDSWQDWQRVIAQREREKKTDV